MSKKNGRPPIFTPAVIEALGEEMLVWFRDPKNVWLKDFAILRGFAWESFSRWAEKNEHFAQSLKKAKDMQEAKLFKLGLSRKVNPAMVIFALKNVAGWRDVFRYDVDGQTSARQVPDDPWSDLREELKKAGISLTRDASRSAGSKAGAKN